MLSWLSDLRWAVMRGLLGTVGRASEGVRIGYRHGFDSGTMLDHVYRNEARGVPLLGTLIDRVHLNAVGWRAIRARRDLLQGILREELAARGGEVLLLDVAAGPGRYLQDLLAEEGAARGGASGGGLRVVCRDLAPAGLEQGRRLAWERGLPADRIRYESGDAFDPVPLPGGRAPDVIVVSGLYELILDDGVIRDSLVRLHAMLAPGGTLLFTTQTRHPQLEFIAHVLPNREGRLWRMRCRPVEEVEEWAVRAGFARGAVVSRREEVGLFTVTAAVRALPAPGGTAAYTDPRSAWTAAPPAPVAGAEPPPTAAA